MCLNTLDTKKQINNFKKEMPQTGLTVFKVVRIVDGKYYPIYRRMHCPYEEGINEARIERIETTCSQSYQSGFHTWLNLADAIEFKENRVEQGYRYEYVIVKCIIRKSWVTSVGENDIAYGDSGKTIVTDKIIFPVM